MSYFQMCLICEASNSEKHLIILKGEDHKLPWDLCGRDEGDYLCFNPQYKCLEPHIKSNLMPCFSILGRQRDINKLISLIITNGVNSTLTLHYWLFIKYVMNFRHFHLSFWRSWNWNYIELKNSNNYVLFFTLQRQRERIDVSLWSRAIMRKRPRIVFSYHIVKTTDLNNDLPLFSIFGFSFPAHHYTPG